jgi:hypothetical protein
MDVKKSFKFEGGVGFVFDSSFFSSGSDLTQSELFLNKIFSEAQGLTGEPMLPEGACVQAKIHRSLDGKTHVTLGWRDGRGGFHRFHELANFHEHRGTFFPAMRHAFERIETRIPVRDLVRFGPRVEATPTNGKFAHIVKISFQNAGKAIKEALSGINMATPEGQEQAVGIIESVHSLINEHISKLLRDNAGRSDPENRRQLLEDLREVSDKLKVFVIREIRAGVTNPDRIAEAYSAVGDRIAELNEDWKSREADHFTVQGAKTGEGLLDQFVDGITNKLLPRLFIRAATELRPDRLSALSKRQMRNRALTNAADHQDPPAPELD